MEEDYSGVCRQRRCCLSSHLSVSANVGDAAYGNTTAMLSIRWNYLILSTVLLDVGVRLVSFGSAVYLNRCSVCITSTLSFILKKEHHKVGDTIYYLVCSHIRQPQLPEYPKPHCFYYLAWCLDGRAYQSSPDLTLSTITYWSPVRGEDTRQDRFLVQPPRRRRRRTERAVEQAHVLGYRLQLTGACLISYSSGLSLIHI